LSISRHLLPHEFDLLLDDEVGFGIPPLQAHVRECEQCASELAIARAAVEQLEHLPHLSASPLFTERVLSQVQVFQPWHAAAFDLARRLVPQSGPVRAVVATAAALAAVTLTGTALWAATRIDAFLLLLGLLAEQTRRALLDVAGNLFGTAAVAAVQAGGGRMLLLASVALFFSALVGVAWLARAARLARSRSVG
jgi:hypothetical protein